MSHFYNYQISKYAPLKTKKKHKIPEWFIQ